MKVTKESDSAPICGLKSKSKPVEMPCVFFPFKANLGTKSAFHVNLAPAERGLSHSSIVKILLFLKASRRQGKEGVLLYR